jgi:hypothetical protein
MRLGAITVEGLNNYPCKIFNKNSPDRSLQDYLPPGETVLSSVFELEQTVKHLDKKVRNYLEIILPIGALALLVAAGGIFLNAYMNLKNDIVTLNKSIGQLEGARTNSPTKLTPQVQPQSQPHLSSPPIDGDKSPSNKNDQLSENPKVKPRK